MENYKMAVRSWFGRGGTWKNPCPSRKGINSGGVAPHYKFTELFRHMYKVVQNEFLSVK